MNGRRHSRWVEETVAGVQFFGGIALAVWLVLRLL